MTSIIRKCGLYRQNLRKRVLPYKIDKSPAPDKERRHVKRSILKQPSPKKSGGGKLVKSLKSLFDRLFEDEVE